MAMGSASSELPLLVTQATWGKGEGTETHSSVGEHSSWEWYGYKWVAMETPDLWCKVCDVVLLFLKGRLRDEHWEVDILHPQLLDASVKEC